MNEHSFIRSVHRQLPDSVYKWKINDPYSGGVADAYYSDSGGDIWVEYKYLKVLPKRDTTCVKYGLTPTQILWLNNRHAEGRNVAVVVGSVEGHVILTDGEWDKPLSKSDFIRRAIDTNAVGAYITRHTTETWTDDDATNHPARYGERQTA